VRLLVVAALRLARPAVKWRIAFRDIEPVTTKLRLGFGTRKFDHGRQARIEVL